MSSGDCKEFQNTAAEYLIRHRSILDSMSKLSDATAHINRAISKSVTACGCLKINATRQLVPEEASLAEIANYAQTHLEGDLCPTCREAIESELGNTLFYIAAVCSLLGLDMDKILANENARISTLGVYSLT